MDEIHTPWRSISSMRVGLLTSLIPALVAASSSKPWIIRASTITLRSWNPRIWHCDHIQLARTAICRPFNPSRQNVHPWTRLGDSMGNCARKATEAVGFNRSAHHYICACEKMRPITPYHTTKSLLNLREPLNLLRTPYSHNILIIFLATPSYHNIHPINHKKPFP